MCVRIHVISLPCDEISKAVVIRGAAIFRGSTVIS